jgi:Tol biopolymer transport system component
MAYVLDDGVWLRDVAAGTNRRLTPVGVHASWPSFGPDGIYFSRVTGTGARQIWRIDPSSGSLTRLLGTPDGSDQPAWTTDGSAMFYVYEGNIERIARNSTRGTIIVTNGSQPAPSPSRGRLAFVRGGAIWTSTFDGAAQVAASTGPQDQHPVWSPPIRQ